jgi:hypothetical protein
MDPAQMATEAVRRLQASCTSSSSIDQRDSTEAITELFEQLGGLDGWAKIARDRVLADPSDARAALELRRSCEQSARLHPAFIRRLDAVIHERPAVKTARGGTVPSQVPPKGVSLPG